MKKLIGLVLCLMVISISAQAVTTWGHARFEQKNNWTIKHFSQRSEVYVERETFANYSDVEFRHKLIWSNHVINPPRISYILVMGYETNCIGDNAGLLGGEVDYQPDNKWTFNMGIESKGIIGATVKGGASYDW